MSAAKELELRRFRVQVFRSNGGLRSLEAAFQEAAPVSSRLVMVETSAAQSRLGLAASRSLARNRIGIPLVRLSFAGPGKQRAGSVPRIMEACLRNLE